MCVCMLVQVQECNCWGLAHWVWTHHTHPNSFYINLSGTDERLVLGPEVRLRHRQYIKYRWQLWISEVGTVLFTINLALVIVTQQIDMSLFSLQWEQQHSCTLAPNKYYCNTYMSVCFLDSSTIILWPKTGPRNDLKALLSQTHPSWLTSLWAWL